MLRKNSFINNLPDLKNNNGCFPTPSIGDELLVFVRQIDSIAGALVMALKVMSTVNEKISESLTQFFNNYGTLVQETEDSRSFSIAQQHAAKSESLKKQYVHAELATAILPRSFIVSLVTQFDAYFSRIIRALYLMKPELLDASGQVLTFSKLSELHSIEAAREFLLEREIEGVLRMTPRERFAWLENKFGVSLRKELMTWHTFIEVTERSHHFVHRNGIISDQYLAVCRELGIAVAETVSVGDTLPVSPEYFESAYRSLYEISVKLAHVLWRKLRPDDLEAADQNLITVTHELIAVERYTMAISLLDFAALTIKNYFSDETRRTFTINRAQAYKWNKQENLCSLILSKDDWVGAEYKFQLAVAALNDNFSLAERIMEKIGPDETQHAAYKQWPLFKEFRKSIEFHRAYENVFKTRFMRVEQVPKTLVA